MQLSEICILRSGFQGKTKKGNDYKQIGLRNVTKDGVIKFEELEGFNADKVNEKYILKKGDIILKAKSGDNTAAIIENDIENVVPASHFIIITIKNRSILKPDYLVAYLNSEYAQNYFKENAEGSVLSIVKIKTLEKLDIKIIEKDKQKEVAEIYKLMQREKITMKKIIENREKQFKTYLREVLN